MFNKFKLQPWLIASLTKLNFTKPRTIQMQVLPQALSNKSLIVQAPTGSGKSHAFLIPLLQKIDPRKNHVQAIIIVPTRELAQQLFHNLKVLLEDNKTIHYKNYTGGATLKEQNDVNNSAIPHLIIGTPTRLKKMYENNSLKLTTAKTLVIDECDMIAELGFLKDLDLLLAKMDRKTQIMVFSATISQKIEIFFQKYLTAATVIKLASEKSNVHINHILVDVKTEKKYHDALTLLLKEINPYLCLIFINKKTEILPVYNLLKSLDYNVAMLHGDLEARTRKQIFKKMNNLAYKYVICSDVIARGVDIVGVSHVISLGFPQQFEYYLHRAGRIREQGYIGESYVLYPSLETNQKQLLEKVQNTGIEFKLSTLRPTSITEIKVKPKTAKILPEKAQKLIFKKLVQQKVVKPGYKKKLGTAVDKIKKDVRDKKIKANIKRQKKEQYFARRKNIFEHEQNS